MEDRPIATLILIFIILGFAWGPIQKNRQENRQSGSAAIGTEPGNIIYTDTKEVSEQIKDIAQEVEDLQEAADKIVEAGRRSPYYGKISLSNISGLRQNNPSREYIVLSTKLSENESLRITGWYLQSEITNYYAVIGKAALLPFPFTRTETDVILKKGDKVYLTKGFSPIGVSFRTNKCTGYFEENRTFYPSLPLECPRPKDESLPTFSANYDSNDKCLDIIDRVRRCQTVDSKFIHDLPDDINNTCKNYLREQINYNSCVAHHVGDTDFPGNQYRLYLNRFGPLWRERSDIINLHDENGLIVDTIEY